MFLLSLERLEIRIPSFTQRLRCPCTDSVMTVRAEWNITALTRNSWQLQEKAVRLYWEKMFLYQWSSAGHHKAPCNHRSPQPALPPFALWSSEHQMDLHNLQGWSPGWRKYSQMAKSNDKQLLPNPLKKNHVWIIFFMNPFLSKDWKIKCFRSNLKSVHVNTFGTWWYLGGGPMSDKELQKTTRQAFI